MTRREAQDEHARAEIASVAVIGAGLMGQPVARRLHRSGFRLMVCDANPAALEAFTDMEVRTTTVAADCAECDVIIVFVATPAQVRAVTIGEGGALTRISADRSTYLVIMSTVLPNDVREINEFVAGKSVRVVDAPVSGGVGNAEKGTLTIMAGGSDHDIAALDEVFAVISDKIFNCGAIGAGQITKIVNNMISVANLMISAEAYRIALDYGLTFDQFIPVLEASSGRNCLSKHPNDAPDGYASWTRSSPIFHSLQSIMRKDVALALSLAKPGMSLPALAALNELVGASADETFGNWRAVGHAKAE